MDEKKNRFVKVCEALLHGFEKDDVKCLSLQGSRDLKWCCDVAGPSATFVKFALLLRLNVLVSTCQRSYEMLKTNISTHSNTENNRI